VHSHVVVLDTVVGVAAESLATGHMLRRTSLVIATERDPDLATGRQVGVDSRETSWAWQGKGKAPVTQSRWSQRERPQCHWRDVARGDRRVREHTKEVADGRCERIEHVCIVAHDRGRVTIFDKRATRLPHLFVASCVAKSEMVAKFVRTNVGARCAACPLVAHKASAIPGWPSTIEAHVRWDSCLLVWGG